MDTQTARDLIQPMLEAFSAEHVHMLFVGACTEDGFVAGHRNGKRGDLEEDKIAAVSSTLLSLSESAVEQAEEGRLKVLVIEGERSSQVLCRTRLDDLPLVVFLAMEQNISIGQTLYLANQLARTIAALDPPDS